MKFLLAAVATFALCATAVAEPPSAPPAASSAAPAGNFMQSCGTDVQSLCPTAQTGKDRHQCIHQNLAKVSSTCSAFVAAKRAERQQMKAQQSAAGTPPAAATTPAAAPPASTTTPATNSAAPPGGPGG